LIQTLDAIQFITANKKSTYIVSFDKDFKGKGIELKTLEEVMNSYFPN
jgi:predicted nucleic acid-binding protein